MNDARNWKMSSKACPKLLLDAHFSCYLVGEAFNSGTGDFGTALSGLLEKRRLAWAVNSFSTLKLAGSADIVPAQLQKVLEVSCCWPSLEGISPGLGDRPLWHLHRRPAK